MGRRILRTVKNLKKKAWDSCSLYIRRKYADQQGFNTCFTCGVKKPYKEMQAGHGIPGRGGSILFEEDLIRPQCYNCNCRYAGRLHIFDYKLREELGNSRYEELYRQHFKPKEWSIDELEQLWNMYKLKIKELDTNG